ncbi:TniB family NTP-binding protein [Oceanobacillus alkalisoli]|uniref:TniB family NTP-binding protein n=1 Tax=Oceanobacillus alkalisoli TaxID=2925113 RepID=UPI001EF07733|nr:TniB family NTP-binding protein [Oceanobacillus alkalisoli]MCF3942294.1 TniB family NTP-binding protein [Oceanobacillus alkalisoli]MCG5103941.1 TniB family NTP-binding protein [Oceanobacillus alkalisoli]
MTKKQRLFDENLLSKSKKEREDYFNDFTVSHPKMQQVLDELKNEIYNGSQNIIMVVGPSGVGKSRLFIATMLSVFKEMKKELEEDKSIIPISGIELPNPDLGKFNWKDFYYRALSSLNEPLIDNKIDVYKYKNNQKNSRPGNVGTAAELRRSIENAFYYRKTKALLIDEAQHFFKIDSESRGNSEKNQRQFNSIKSLANMSNTKIVLFGTYDLNAVFNLDGQLSRRVKEIHFPRYDYAKEEDRKTFKSLLFTFQKLLPVEVEPNLYKHSEYLYEGSIGCAGILKNWLQRCLSDAIKHDEKTITYDNLKRNALQTRKLLTLGKEAIEGELAFKDSDKDKEKLKELLGINKNEEQVVRERKINKTPGKRKPERDSVGTELPMRHIQ